MQLRFGIKIVRMHTKIKNGSPFGMDGPAYHIAREMITQLKTLEPTANIKIGIPSTYHECFHGRRTSET